MPHSRLYDSSRLQSVDENDEGVVSYMLGIFLLLIPSVAGEIREAYYAMDLDLVRKLSHRIKPSILELDIRSIKGTIAEIEKEASRGEPSPALEVHIEYLYTIMQQVKEQIQEELAAMSSPHHPDPLPVPIGK